MHAGFVKILLSLYVKILAISPKKTTFAMLKKQLEIGAIKSTNYNTLKHLS